MAERHDILERREAGMEWKSLIHKHTLACLAGGFVIGLAVCGVGSAAMSFSGSATFCGNACHAMQSEGWTFAESSHRNQECVECHLPHDNMAIYLIEKGRTGMVDTYHEVLRDYPAHIKLSAEGKKTVNANCLRCHKATVEKVHADIGVDKDSGGDCMKCHSSVAHGANHIERGIKVE